MWEKIKAFSPFELKRKASSLSIIFALIVAGFLAKTGEWIFDLFIGYFRLVIPSVNNFFTWAQNTTIEVSLVSLFFYVIAFIALLFPSYRKFDRAISKFSRFQIIFEDDFDYNKGWILNYWGTREPSKTNRLQDSLMYFQAQPHELLHPVNEYGAYIDLKDGIFEGNTYEISCKVKSDPGTTMGIQLWVHDTIGGDPSASKKDPETFITPSINFSVLKLRYLARPSNALRIHLHVKPGQGQIMVDKLRVVKI